MFSRLQRSSIDKIDKLIRNFLWSQDGCSNRIYLINWAQISKSKDKGGLGLFIFRYIKKALLGKLPFRLIDNKDDLWVQWVYFVFNFKDDFLNQQRPSKLSPLMKEILKASKSIKEGTICSVDNKFKWGLDPKHTYSTKSGMNLIRVGSITNLQDKTTWKWKTIWKLKLIPNIKYFLWKLLIGGLPQKNDSLAEVGMVTDYVMFAMLISRMTIMCYLNALMLQSCGV